MVLRYSSYQSLPFSIFQSDDWGADGKILWHWLKNIFCFFTYFNSLCVLFSFNVLENFLYKWWWIHEKYWGLIFVTCASTFTSIKSPKNCSTSCRNFWIMWKRGWVNNNKTQIHSELFIFSMVIQSNSVAIWT